MIPISALTRPRHVFPSPFSDLSYINNLFICLLRASYLRYAKGRKWTYKGPRQYTRMYGFVHRMLKKVYPGWLSPREKDDED